MGLSNSAFDALSDAFGTEAIKSLIPLEIGNSAVVRVTVELQNRLRTFVALAGENELGEGGVRAFEVDPSDGESALQRSDEWLQVFGEAVAKALVNRGDD